MRVTVRAGRSSSYAEVERIAFQDGQGVNRSRDVQPGRNGSALRSADSFKLTVLGEGSS
jgi:hypothetical protein